MEKETQKNNTKETQGRTYIATNVHKERAFIDGRTGQIIAEDVDPREVLRQMRK